MNDYVSDDSQQRRRLIGTLCRFVKCRADILSETGGMIKILSFRLFCILDFYPEENKMTTEISDIESSRKGDSEGVK